MRKRTRRFALTSTMTFLVMGCSAETDFARVFEESVKVAKQSNALADDSRKSLLRAYALGLTNATPATPQNFTCVNPAGADVVQDDLTLFADSIETVNKVATKPTDTSYAGYLRQFTINANAPGPPKSFADQQAEHQTKIRTRRARCEKLFAADLSAAGLLKTPASTGGDQPPIFGLGKALDGLVKTVLATAEAAQREMAVRRTISYVLPQMEKAIEQLDTTPAATFGAIVQYPKDAPDEVVVANGTLLGALVNEHRWLLAHRIEASWNDLKRCRDRNTDPNRADFSCLSNRDDVAAVDQLIADMTAYQAVAAIDAKKILTDLKTAISNAKTGADTTSLATVIDGFAKITSALSDISDAYDKFQKAKD